MDERDGLGSWGPSLYYLAIALGVVAGGLAFLLFGPSSRAPAPAPEVAGRAASSPLPIASDNSAPEAPVRAAAVRASRSVADRRTVAAAAPSASAAEPEVGSDPTTDISAYVNPGEVPTMAEVIERLQLAGVAGGLAAFPPPGTRPPLVGLAVPEDFVLPEGYVRHYQATDDGQRIEPVLMYSPDRDARWRDAAPEDRLVPPEHAPPGLPLRRIEIPAPVPGRPGR